MRRRTALSLLGGSISTALAGCLASADDEPDVDDQETEEPDPHADLDVVDEMEVDGWLLSAEVSEIESTRIYDQEAEELVTVEPTEDSFAEIWIRARNLLDEPRVPPFAEALNSIEILVDGEPYEPIEQLPGGYGWDEQRADRELMSQPTPIDARTRADSRALSIRVYDVLDGEIVVDTRSVDGADAVLDPQIIG